ncbi:MAG: glycosyltransferase family 4 protein [Janthinobacterium lividum]
MNQFFWPDSAATSQLLTDLARDLASTGHQVEVICGGSYAATAAEDAPAVAIHRVNTVKFSRSTLGRIVSYATFYLGAAYHALTMPKQDVVFTLTTPPLLSAIGALVRKIRGSRFFIWEMDVYPDIAIDLGYLRADSPLTKVIGLIADWSRRQADGIVVLGECMRARLAARGIDSNKMFTVDNWADSTQIRVLPRSGDLPLQVVYSGNLGLAHDVDTILGAMDQLNDDARFHFTFGGGGARHSQLSDFIREKNFHQVTIRPYVARADLSQVLGFGDIGLVTQRDDCCGSVVPSKIYGLMAAGRAILFIGPIAAAPAHIVTTYRCGWHIACGDSDSLVGLLQHLATHPDEIETAGRNARQALLEHFDRPIGTRHIMALLTQHDVSVVLSPRAPAEEAEPTVLLSN